MFKPWMLAAMEEEGYTDTKDGHINRVAKYLSKSESNIIGNSEFIEACRQCDVDPYSFSEKDLYKLQQKLK